MRKLVVSNIISVDGFFAGPDGDVMAMPFDDGFSRYNLRRLREADTLLLGRITFESFRDYWPSVAEDPNQPDVEREISRRNDAVQKIVVSDSLTPEQTAPWDATRIVPRSEAHATIAELKQGDGGEILTFGSRVLWNDLLAAGLVDELHLMIGPALLGEGVPVFDTAVSVPLRLLEARVLPDSELLLARYAPEELGRRAS